MWIARIETTCDWVEIAIGVGKPEIRQEKSGGKNRR